MTVSSAELFRSCSKQLEGIYGAQEAGAISFLLLENLFSLSRTEILADKKLEIEEKKERLSHSIDRLRHNEPIQYILGQTEFYGLPILVNPSVLIPRQETEELVQLIISEHENKKNSSILDIGTGSGCIAIALKKALPQSAVYAMDVSEQVLSMAKKNAELNKVEIQFLEKNILLPETTLPETTIIVSNPPYVLQSEKKEMKENVLAHEPHLALFVEDSDPLLFYRTIVEKAKKYLLKDGSLYFEINEQFGKETIKLLTDTGFTEVRSWKDLNRKDRMIRAKKI